MFDDGARLTDSVFARAGYGRPSVDRQGIHGWVSYELRGPDGRVKQRGRVPNLVTEVGDRFYGDRAAGILGSTVAITAITNATSAVVTTGSAHGFTVGDRVIIAGVTPSGYNGSWAISAVGSATTFTIYVGTALGAGSAFGTAQGLTLGNVTGMRLGTGTTAVAKTGAGAAIVTYVTASQLALDATYPLSTLNGSSRRIRYFVTWAAGVATANGIAEAVITNETPLSNVAGTAANTIARALLSPTVNKAAGDTLTVDWAHDLLGA
jgi:hypothetical protein